MNEVIRTSCDLSVTQDPIQSVNLENTTVHAVDRACRRGGLPMPRQSPLHAALLVRPRTVVDIRIGKVN